MAKKQTFKDNSPEEIDRAIMQARDELRGLRFSVAGSKNQNVKRVSVLRKTIARGLTRKNAKGK